MREKAPMRRKESSVHVYVHVYVHVHFVCAFVCACARASSVIQVESHTHIHTTMRAYVCHPHLPHPLVLLFHPSWYDACDDDDDVCVTVSHHPVLSNGMRTGVHRHADGMPCDGMRSSSHTHAHGPTHTHHRHTHPSTSTIHMAMSMSMPMSMCDALCLCICCCTHLLCGCDCIGECIRHDRCEEKGRC